MGSRSPDIVVLIVLTLAVIFVLTVIARAIRIVPQAQVMTYRVPGAFEIPVCAQFVLTHTEPDAVIALGVIVRARAKCPGRSTLSTKYPSVERGRIGYSPPVPPRRNPLDRYWTITSG